MPTFEDALRRQCPDFSPMTPWEAGGVVIPRWSVPGRQALKIWRGLKDRAHETGAWPILMGDVEDPPEPASDDGMPVDDILRAAKSLDAEACLRDLELAATEQFADDPEALEYRESVISQTTRWPRRPPDPTSPQFLTLREGLAGALCDRIVLAACPTSLPFQVPAYFGFGGFNECPDPPVHVALWRRWLGMFHAEPVCLTNESLEAWAQRPPRRPEEARALAREQYSYCPDIVDQGCELVDVLAVGLWRSPQWFFWWD